MGCRPLTIRFYPYPPAQALSWADRPLLHVQAQLPPRTTPPTNHSATSVEALGWYLPQQPTPTDPQSWPAHRQDMAPPPMPLTHQSAVDTTHHFLSTHRRSPTSLSSHGSDHSLKSTMMATNGSAPPQVARNLNLNLADSPSWNSATTPMRIPMRIPPLDHFYPLSATFQGVPGTRSTSRPNTASTSLAALAIPDAPASSSYEQPNRHQSPICAGV